MEQFINSLDSWRHLLHEANKAKVKVGRALCPHVKCDGSASTAQSTATAFVCARQKLCSAALYRGDEAKTKHPLHVTNYY